MLLGFCIYFLATWTTDHLTCAVSLQAGKNHAVHHTTSILAQNDAENILLSENTVVLCVSVTGVSPSPPPPLSIQRYRQLADRDWQLNSNNTSHILYVVVPIIQIFMIDLNRKSTIKKIELIEKLAKKDQCTHWSMIDLLSNNFIWFHGVKGPIDPHTYG